MTDILGSSGASQTATPPFVMWPDEDLQDHVLGEIDADLSRDEKGESPYDMPTVQMTGMMRRIIACLRATREEWHRQRLELDQLAALRSASVSPTGCTHFWKWDATTERYNCAHCPASVEEIGSRGPSEPTPEATPDAWWVPGTTKPLRDAYFSSEQEYAQTREAGDRMTARINGGYAWVSAKDAALVLARIERLDEYASGAGECIEMAQETLRHLVFLSALDNGAAAMFLSEAIRNACILCRDEALAHDEDARRFPPLPENPEETGSELAVASSPGEPRP